MFNIAMLAIILAMAISVRTSARFCARLIHFPLFGCYRNGIDGEGRARLVGREAHIWKDARPSFGAVL